VTKAKLISWVGGLACAFLATSLRAEEVLAKSSVLDSSMLARADSPPARGSRMGSGADGGSGGWWESISLTGSLDVAYTFNFNPTKIGGGPENPTRVFDTFHNEFTVHNSVLRIRKAATDESIFGFAITPTYGTDGAFTAGGGLNTGGLDFDVLEMYGELRIPQEVMVLGGGTIEVGKFLTAAGAEVIESQLNAMFSRTFMFGNAIPFTHTGVRYKNSFYERADKVNMIDYSIGFANGWDDLRDRNDGQVVLVSGKVSPTDYMQFYANWFFGFANRFGATFSDTRSVSHLIDLVANISVPGTGDDNVQGSGLSFNFNVDWYGDENESGGNAGAPPAGYASYFAYAGIVKYDFANPLSSSEDMCYVAFRGEFVDDNDGFLRTVNAGLGNSEQLWDLTATFGYRPTSNVLIRAEVRYDKAVTPIFENGTRSHQATLALNTVFSF
jgi:hypothetical protein